MFSIDEYIKKRKNADKINEFNQSRKNENMKACLNYVVDYYTQYLDPKNIEFLTNLHNGKLQKYKKEIKHLDPEVINWLLEIYGKHEAKLNVTVSYYLKNIETLHLHNTDGEIKEIVQNFYNVNLKRLPYIQSQQPKLSLLIKNIIDLKNKENKYELTTNFKKLTIFDHSIIQWLTNTYKNCSVNLFNFSCDYIDKFATNNYMGCDNDYKRRNDLFGIDSLYEKIKGKPYLQGRKKDLELLFMYNWLDMIVEDKPFGKSIWLNIRKVKKSLKRVIYIVSRIPKCFSMKNQY